MLSRLKNLLRTPDKPGDIIKPEADTVIPGYFSPQGLDTLTAFSGRQPLLNQMRENSALPAELYPLLYLAPLHQLLLSTQNVPAALSGPWSGVGGFGDMTIKFTTCAMRLARGYMFPPGAAPEEQAAQNVLWNAVIYWAALFYHVPLLFQLEAELRDGALWAPGLTVPDRPFRFRFRASPLNAAQVQSLSAMLSFRLLPEEAMLWLCSVPEALSCLSDRLYGTSASVPLIDELLGKAAQTLDTPSLPVSNTAISENGSVPMTTSALPLKNDSDIQPAIDLFSLDNGGHQPTTLAVTPADEAVSDKGDVNQKEGKGSEFLFWLSSGLRNGSIGINEEQARIHLIAGCAFLCVPEIFYLFIKDTGSKTKRNTIQSAFERLGIHKIRAGERFMRARVYSNPAGTGTFRAVTGYLVKASSLYRGDPLPDDSLLFMLQ